MTVVVEAWEELRYNLVITIVCDICPAAEGVNVLEGNVNVTDLPQLRGRPMVTDGGMETDLIFHHGVDLPLFAAFPLIDSPEGRSLLTGYYQPAPAAGRRPAGPGHRGRVLRDRRPARRCPLELTVCHSGNVACSLGLPVGTVHG
jgi:hypothetical protein